VRLIAYGLLVWAMASVPLILVVGRMFRVSNQCGEQQGSDAAEAVTK
jgi:hypothetical protein